MSGTAQPAPAKELPDSLFIFVMCCCALAVGAVVFVFVYYCYLNSKLCFKGNGIARRRRRRAHLGSPSGSVQAGNDEHGGANGSDDGSVAHLVVQMEERLLADGKQPEHVMLGPPAEPAPQPTQAQASAGSMPPANAAGAAVPPQRQEGDPDSSRLLDPAALLNAKFTHHAHQVRDLDRGDELTNSGVAHPAARYYQGGERYEFLVLPEKAPSVAANAASDGSNGRDEVVSVASTGSTRERRWLAEWLRGATDALLEARRLRQPLDDPAPYLTSNPHSPHSSDRSDCESRAHAPTLRRVAAHRLSRASESSGVSQPSTTAQGVPTPPGSAQLSPQSGLGQSQSHGPMPPVAPVPLRRPLAQPSPPPAGGAYPSQAGRPPTARRLSRDATATAPPAPMPQQQQQQPQVVTLAQLMENPFRASTANLPVEVLTPRHDTPPPRLPAAVTTAAAAPQPQPDGRKTAGQAAASGPGMTPRRILSDTSSSSSNRS